MSKNLESYSLQTQMREDLMRCYREIAPNCITQAGAWRKTVLHPAPRYYVSARQAYQQINLYLQGRTEEIDKMKPLHRERWMCLIQEVLKIAQEPEHQGKPLTELTKIAVERPAPQFFIQPERMKSLFRNTKYNRYDKNGILIKDYERRSNNNKWKTR